MGFKDKDWKKKVTYGKFINQANQTEDIFLSAGGNPKYFPDQVPMWVEDVYIEASTHCFAYVPKFLDKGQMINLDKGEKRIMVKKERYTFVECPVPAEDEKSKVKAELVENA